MPQGLSGMGWHGSFAPTRYQFQIHPVMDTPSRRCGRMFKARIFPEAKHLEAEVASLLAGELRRSPSTPSALMLAGGRTPLAAYARLAATSLDISVLWHVLYSDDRHVPLCDPRSNAGAISPLLHRTGLPPGRILQVAGDRPLADSTAQYQSALATFIGAGGRVPLGLLGLGADGHTASLFNADQVAAGGGHWAQAVARPDGLNGVSVTADFLARVDRLVFLVTGAEKRDAARLLLTRPDQVAAGLAVAGAPRVEVWFDQAAWPLDPDPARTAPRQA